LRRDELAGVLVERDDIGERPPGVDADPDPSRSHGKDSNGPRGVGALAHPANGRGGRRQPSPPRPYAAEPAHAREWPTREPTLTSGPSPRRTLGPRASCAWWR